MSEYKNRDFWLYDLDGMNCTVYFVYLGKRDTRGEPQFCNPREPVTKEEQRKLYEYIVDYLYDYFEKYRIHTTLFPDYANCDKIVLFKDGSINNNDWRDDITKTFGDLVIIPNLKDITGDTKYKYCYIKYYFEFRFSETYSVSYNITDPDEV